MPLALLVVLLGSPTSYAEYSRYLKAHKAAFEELAAMCQHDTGMRRISKDFTAPPVGTQGSIDSGRYQRYIRLFEQLHIQGGMLRRDDGPVLLLADVSGRPGHSMAHGYAYVSEGEPSPLVQDVEAAKSRPRSTVVYKRITRHWYEFDLR
jgi:hypothetical protein